MTKRVCTFSMWGLERGKEYNTMFSHRNEEGNTFLMVYDIQTGDMLGTFRADNFTH